VISKVNDSRVSDADISSLGEKEAGGMNGGDGGRVAEAERTFEGVRVPEGENSAVVTKPVEAEKISVPENSAVPVNCHEGACKGEAGNMELWVRTCETVNLELLENFRVAVNTRVKLNGEDGKKVLVGMQAQWSLYVFQ
jgi:hypothetical protein